MLAAQVTDKFLSQVDTYLRSPPVAAGSMLHVHGSAAVGNPTITATTSTAGLAVGDVGMSVGAVNTPVTVLSFTANTVTFTTNLPATEGVEVYLVPPSSTGILGTPSIGLFTNAPALSNLSVLADMTEPTFAGYAQVVTAIEPVQRNVAGDYLEKEDVVHFQPTTNVGLPVTANGYFVTASIGGTTFLLAAEYFAAPMVFLDSTTGLDLIYEGMVRNLKNWGGLCSAC